MAHNPHAPQGPENSQDPAGSTQMFRAFVEEEGGPGGARRSAPQAASSGSRTGLVLGIVAAVVVIGAAIWLAMA